MQSIKRSSWMVLFLSIVFALTVASDWGDGAVDFSGKVKKVIAAKHKVAIKDPATKKRFTVVVNDQSKLKGFSAIGDLKKGDAVTGKYIVTDKGLYVAVEMTKK